MRRKIFKCKDRLKPSRFDLIIPFVLKWETVFAKGHDGDYKYAVIEKDPDDEGNYVNGKLVGTKFGIDARSHPEINLKELDVEGAKEIYLKDYWEKFKCESYLYPLGEIIFNCAVNCGFGRVKKILATGVETGDSFLDEQEDFYRRLAAAKPTNQKFLKGWLNRVDALRAHLNLQK